MYLKLVLRRVCLAMENNITVSLDDMVQKLELMQEDGCNYVTLEINDDGYDSEVVLKGHNPDVEEPVEYGVLSRVSDDSI